MPTLDEAFDATFGATPAPAPLSEKPPRGLDEAFNPAQFEDFDFCYRARQAGWRVAYEPSVELYHFENVTTDGSPDVKFRYVTIKNWVEFKRRWRGVYEQEEGPDEAECQWAALQTHPLEHTGIPPMV